MRVVNIREHKNKLQLRDALRGAIGRDALPWELRNLFDKIIRQYRRQQMRWHNTEFRGQKHRAAALAGGGKREVARRARQIAAGQLRVSA